MPVVERTSFEDWNCSAARALEVVGDWWTMMIVREAMYGTRRFSDFQQRLGISRSMLTRRLQKMEDDGLLSRRPSQDDKRSGDYRLTSKGKSLFTILVALMQWGDQWEQGGKPPVIFLDRRTGQPLDRLVVRDVQGNPVKPSQLVPAPGPGADEETVGRFFYDKRTASAKR